METAYEKQQFKKDLMMCGRRKIYVTTEDINEDNIVNVMNEVIGMHLFNFMQEEYLYWYRRGVQPILFRKKEVRPEILSTICVNNADMVVTFKNGYFMTAPCSYSSRVDDEGTTQNVKRFNDYCIAAGKPIVDNEVVDWFHTVGVGNLFIEPDKDGNERTPFHVYALDPRSSCVGYSYRPGNRPVLGMNAVVVGDQVLFDAFTRDTCYHLRGGLTTQVSFYDSPIIGTATTLIGSEPNVLGEIPIIEYQYDINRMGCFEAALPICDEINEMQSRLAEGVEEQIQQLCIAVNCNFDDDTTANDIRKAGMIALRSDGENKAEFKILTTELSQEGTQLNIDKLYEQLLDKTGLPSISRGEGGSSDNGSAVYLKAGYSIADTNRRNTEDFWRKSDEQFKRVALKIVQMRFSDFELEPEDFVLNIEPPTMSNLLVKSQSAMNMRELGLAPQIWLERSGLSNDPLSDIEVSKDYIYRYYEENKSEDKPQEELEMEGQALSDDRQAEELSSFMLD